MLFYERINLILSKVFAKFISAKVARILATFAGSKNLTGTKDTFGHSRDMVRRLSHFSEISSCIELILYSREKHFFGFDSLELLTRMQSRGRTR